MFTAWMLYLTIRWDETFCKIKLNYLKKSARFGKERKTATSVILVSNVEDLFTAYPNNYFSFAQSDTN